MLESGDHKGVESEILVSVLVSKVWFGLDPSRGLEDFVSASNWFNIAENRPFGTRSSRPISRSYGAGLEPAGLFVEWKPAHIQRAVSDGQLNSASYPQWQTASRTQSPTLSGRQPAELSFLSSVGDGQLILTVPGTRPVGVHLDLVLVTTRPLLFSTEWKDTGAERSEQKKRSSEEEEPKQQKQNHFILCNGRVCHYFCVCVPTAFRIFV